MKALLPLLFFIIYCQFIPANVNAAKQHKAEYRLKDTVLVLDLIKKARESLYQSLDSAFIYAKKAIKISGKIGYTKGKGWGYHRISQAFDVLGSSDSAFKYGNIAQQYLRSINDSLGLAHSLYTFGNIYLYKSWYEAALKYYFDANVIYQKLKSASDINNCDGAIGIVYLYLKDWRRSLYFLILTAEYEKKANNETGLAETYGDIGSVYVKLGKQDSAFIYFKLAEKIAVKTNNMRVLTAINNNLGSIARERHDYTSAIRYITKSIELKNTYKYNEGLGENYINLGAVYALTGNYQKALNYFNQAIEYCKQFNAKEDLVTGYKSLSELYEKNGDIRNALAAYKNYLNLNDSLSFKKYNERVAQWQTLYELKNNEFKLEGANKELTIKNITIKKNRVFQSFLLTLVGALVLASILLILMIRFRNAMLKNAELQVKNKEFENRQLLDAKKIHELELHNSRKEISMLTLNFISNNDTLSKIMQIAENEDKQEGNNLYTSLDKIKQLAFDYIDPELYWKKFRQTFDHTNPGYFGRIKTNYPELSEYEIKLCAYISVGLKSEEIAKILHITAPSVNKSRNRLRKKLSVTEGVNLAEFLENI